MCLYFTDNVSIWLEDGNRIGIEYISNFHYWAMENISNELWLDNIQAYKEFQLQ